MNRLLLLLGGALLGGGCISLDQNGPGISYNLAPQEFVQDFGNQAGTLMDVSCAMGGDAVCAQLPVPMGTTSTCDVATQKCVLHADVRLTQAINLSQQSGFPSSVASSSAVQSVTVGAVHYWTPSNTLTFASPPIDIYVGSQSTQKETDPGVTRLGTVPSLPAGARTNCRNGATGTQDSACDMPLTPEGQNALGTFAKDYRTPFQVLVVAHLTVHSGEPVPSGKLDIFIQPALLFHVR